VGGTEQYTQSLARAQVKRGHRVAIFFPTAGSASGQVLSVVTEPDGPLLYALQLGQRSRNSVFASTFRQQAASRAFAETLSREAPELVHVQHLMGLPASLVTQIAEAGIPYLVTLHDYWFPCANGQLVTNYDQTLCAGPRMWVNCGRCALARAGRDSRLLAPSAPLLAPLMAYRSRLLRRVLAGAACIVAPSEFVSRQYRLLGMPADHMVVVPHGIKTPEALPRRGDKRSSASTPLQIVYLGSVAWQKGVHVLVDAVNQLPVAEVQLSIFGDLNRFPDYVSELRSRAKHPGIHFGGLLEREAVWEKLAAADVVAIPSLWYENSPIVVHEARAAGVPIIASRLGALIEHVQDGHDGLLIAPGDVAAWRDAFARFSVEPALLARLRAGIQPARTVEEHLDDIEAIYHQIIARNRSDF